MKAKAIFIIFDYPTIKNEKGLDYIIEKNCNTSLT